MSPSTMSSSTKAPKFLTSRKFWAMVIGIVVTVAVNLVPTLADLEDNLTELLSVIVAYILGTGLADFRKSKVEI